MHLDSVYPIVGGNMDVEFISEKDCVRVALSGEIDEYGAKFARCAIDEVIENTPYSALDDFRYERRNFYRQHRAWICAG